jgi:hypothetical protein
MSDRNHIGHTLNYKYQKIQDLNEKVQENGINFF